MFSFISKNNFQAKYFTKRCLLGLRFRVQYGYYSKVYFAIEKRKKKIFLKG